MLAPAQSAPLAPQRARVVLDAKLAADQVADTRQSLAVGIEAAGERAFAEQLKQALPIVALQTRRPPGDGFGLERQQAVAGALEVFGPLADSGAADADFADDFGLRELAGFEELAGVQAALSAVLAA